MGSLITIVSPTHGSLKNKHIHFIHCSIFWHIISECSSSSLTHIAKVALIKLQCPVSITFQNSPLQFSAHTYTVKSRTNLPQVNESNFFCFLDFFEGIVYRILIMYIWMHKEVFLGKWKSKRASVNMMIW